VVKSIWVTYHDVFRNRPQADLPASATLYHVSENLFKYHLDSIQSSGLSFVNAIDAINGQFHSDSIIFTFDDGWAGLYDVVLPLFRKNNLNGVAFITRDFIGKEGFLTQSQIVELSKANFEIGLHGTTHRLLSSCTSKEITWELNECKSMIEDLTGKQVLLAALPGGEENPLIESISRKLGLVGVCTSRPGFHVRSPNRYFINRISIRHNTSRQDMQRYCKFSIYPEIFRWYLLRIPHLIFKGRGYSLLRRFLLGDFRKGKKQLFLP
jgi:peptidoglycan/xylan/chitin deacetylase (PgdA/CDA1 family)